MTERELYAIYYALLNAKTCIEKLGNENYPYEPFKLEEIGNMFYKVNDLCIEVSNMIEKARTNK